MFIITQIPEDEVGGGCHALVVGGVDDRDRDIHRPDP
jgi:hypothetical protein